jgi:hypothetical protein
MKHSTNQSESSPGSQGSNGGSESSSASLADDEAASALKSTVTAGAHDLSQKAKDVAGGVVGQARTTVESQLSGGKERLAQGLGSVAKAMRHTGEQLRSQDKLGLPDYVSRAAEKVDAASEYLQGRNLGDVLGDLGSFARREPAIFLGGAFAVGLIGGRFLKSSHPQPALGSGANNGYGGRTSSSGASGYARSSNASGGSSNGGRESVETARTLPGAGMDDARSDNLGSTEQGAIGGSTMSRAGAV